MVDFELKTREIKKDDGTVMWDSKGILDSWKTYCERVYQDGTTPEMNQSVTMVEVTGEDEPNIPLDEVGEMMSAIKKRKAHGYDGIWAKLWQALMKVESKQYGNSVVWYGRVVNGLLNGVSECWFPCIWKEMQDNAKITKQLLLIAHSSKVILQILNN